MVTEPEPSTDAAASPTPAHRPSSARRVVLVVACVALVVLVDQLTKAWALDALADGPINVVGNTVQFSLARNTGAAFSMFTALTPVLAIVAIIVAIVLVRLLRSASNAWTVAGLSLVLGGALGNLGDRIFRASGFLNGAVIDFIKVGWWPTFNIADAAITVGVAILVWRSFLHND